MQLSEGKSTSTSLNSAVTKVNSVEVKFVVDDDCLGSIRVFYISGSDSAIHGVLSRNMNRDLTYITIDEHY